MNTSTSTSTTSEPGKREVPQNWYFTFGYGQNPGIGYYTVIFGTYNDAREEMVIRYGRNWAFQYPSVEKAGVERFNLKRVN